jgi:hypothetical protein
MGSRDYRQTWHLWTVEAVLNAYCDPYCVEVNIHLDEDMLMGSLVSGFWVLFHVDACSAGQSVCALHTWEEWLWPRRLGRRVILTRTFRWCAWLLPNWNSSLPKIQSAALSKTHSFKEHQNHRIGERHICGKIPKLVWNFQISYPRRVYKSIVSSLPFYNNLISSIVVSSLPTVETNTSVKLFVRTVP